MPAIESAGLTESPDEVSADLGFRNIHYFAAAATQYGTQAKGGYEYDGNSYDIKFYHVDGFNTCNTCHDPHTLEINIVAVPDLPHRRERGRGLRDGPHGRL